MNYEKKYKDALELAKDYFKANQKLGELEENDMLSDIFPELRESEDERIRKMLIEFFGKGAECNGSTNGISDKDILAWLERQGKKPIGICSGHAIGKLGEIIKDIEAEQFDKYEGLTDFERTLADICIGWIGEEFGWKKYIKDNADILLKIAIEKFNSVQDVQFERKPTDEEMKEALRTEYEKGRADAIAEMQVAWSEEDDAMIDNILGTYKTLEDMLDLTNNERTCLDEIHWLKSLKQRI